MPKVVLSFDNFENKNVPDINSCTAHFNFLPSNSKQGPLTEGEGSVQLTSLYKLIRSAAFVTANVFTYYFLTKQPTLMRRPTVMTINVEVIRTDP